MKLSEILPDWIKKREFIPTNCSKASKDMEKEGQFNGYPRGMKNEVMAHYQNGYFKGALDVLSSCDREIDREALAMQIKHIGGVLVPMLLARAIAKSIISTMPTWLKRSEYEAK